MLINQPNTLDLYKAEIIVCVRCDHPELFPFIRKYLKHKLKTISTKLSEFPKIPHTIHIRQLKAMLGLLHPRVYFNTSVGPSHTGFISPSGQFHPRVYFNSYVSISLYRVYFPHIHIANRYTCI